jgi:hypothetical protein
MLSKSLVLGVICLFICVGVQPVFAVESNVSVDNTEDVEDCDCETVVSDVDLNCLDKITDFRDLINMITTMKNINADNNGICFFLFVVWCFHLLRFATIWTIHDMLLENGNNIIANIIWNYMDVLSLRAEQLEETARSYECGWAE